LVVQTVESEVQTKNIICRNSGCSVGDSYLVSNYAKMWNFGTL